MNGSRLLDGYVLRRLVLSLVLSVVGLLVIAIIIDLTENLDTFIDFHARAREIFFYYVYHAPYWIILTLPIAGLLGTLFALTGLARSNEIMAMKALGISLNRILMPVFACALAVGGIAFLFTDHIVPAATYRYNQIRDRITAYNRPNGSRRQVLLQDADGQMLYVGRYDPIRQQGQNAAYERRSGDRLVERINARTLKWRGGKWVMLDGHAYRTHDIPSPGATTDNARAAAGGTERRAGPSLAIIRFDSLALDALTLLPADLGRQQKRPEEMNYAELSQYIRRAEANGLDVTRYQVDLHLKIAFPLTCFIIIVLGAPLGANARRAGMANSFGVGIAVCFVFYSCVKAGQALGWNKIISPWAGAWSANILFGVLSLVLLWRAHK